MVLRVNAPGKPVVLIDLGRSEGRKMPWETMRIQGLDTQRRRPKP